MALAQAGPEALSGDSTRQPWSYFQKLRPSKSKPIFDVIDHILSQHYHFTPDEEDFVINYGIKYRIGQDEAEDAE